MNANIVKQLEARGLKLRSSGVAAPVGVDREDGATVVSSGEQRVRVDMLDAAGKVIASATAPSHVEAADAAVAQVL